MAASAFYLGFDISTQGAKLLALAWPERTVVWTSTLQYDEDLPQYATHEGRRQHADPCVSEADPKMWIDAVEVLLGRWQRSGFDGQRVRALSVSGQQHGLVCVDAGGRLTRPWAKLWNDTSTQEECRELHAALGGEAAMQKAVGMVQRPGFTASKILHFKKEDPRAFARTASFLLVHNYINMFLSGGVRVMEAGDASGMALMDPVRKSWHPEVCAAIDPQLIQALPPLRPAHKPIGRIAPELAERFGISPEAWIAAGSGDNMMGAIGTGNVKPGIVTVSLGTSGTAYAFRAEPLIEADPDVAGFCDATGSYLPLVCVANLANGYRQCLETFGWTHAEFARALEATAPGNEGRLLVPWFRGERTPDLPAAAGTYFGFHSLADFRPEVLARAVLEGHVLHLHQAYQKLGVQAKLVHLTGGLTRSQAFCQAIADIFAMDVLVLEGEGAALGAALHAAWTDGVGPIEELCATTLALSQAARIKPRADVVPIYEQVKLRYQTLAQALLASAEGLGMLEVKP